MVEDLFDARNLSDREILLLVANEQKTIAKNLEEIKDVLSSKVSHEEFKKLEKTVAELSEKQNKVTDKLTYFAGVWATIVAIVSGAASFLANKLF